MADDIIGPSSYEAVSPEKREFLPWHRPRKQFVRERQWREQIVRLLDDAPLQNGDFKYLGLPGVDLLDLRYFHSEICAPRGCRLSFLGFNSGAQPTSQANVELNISLDEVRKLGNVDPRSDVRADNFANLSNAESLAWKAAQQLGPYDVINLDLCDGFGIHAPNNIEETHYNAMQRLMALQARSPRPWLLMLTTRAGHAHVHPAVLQALLDKYRDNLDDCPAFRDLSHEFLEIGDHASLLARIQNPAAFLSCFLCALCKWLGGLCLQHNPPTEAEVKSVIGYRVDVGAAHEDLISIAIRFTPTFHPVADPIGLAQNQGAAPNECAQATQALNRIRQLRNADELLANDGALALRMQQAMGDLLVKARYDRAAYDAWVAENP